MANKEKLFTEFTAPTKQEWLDKIEVDLEGVASVAIAFVPPALLKEII